MGNIGVLSQQSDSVWLAKIRLSRCDFNVDDLVGLAAVHEGIDGFAGTSSQAEDNIHPPFLMGIEHGIGEIPPVVDHDIPWPQGLQVPHGQAAFTHVRGQAVIIERPFADQAFALDDRLDGR